MLRLTASAAAALEQARDEQDVPQDFGVRVSTHAGPDGQVGLAVGFTETPAEGDAVSEQAGTELYVAQEVAEVLSESIIDIEETAEGAQLVVRAQQPEGDGRP